VRVRQDEGAFAILRPAFRDGSLPPAPRELHSQTSFSQAVVRRQRQLAREASVDRMFHMRERSSALPRRNTGTA
jgi:hypothetical protein